MYDFRLIQLNPMHGKLSRFSFNFISNQKAHQKNASMAQQSDISILRISDHRKISVRF